MSTTPLWMVFLSSWRERRVPHRLVIAGLVLGIAGVALLTGRRRGLGWFDGDRLALVGAGLSWAAGSLIGRDGPKPDLGGPINRHAVAGRRPGGAAAERRHRASFPAGAPSSSAPEEWSRSGFWCWAEPCWDSERIPGCCRRPPRPPQGPTRFVNPIVALALAWLVGDEPFALRTVFAGIVVVAGVLLIWRSSATESHLREAAHHPERGRESALRRVLGALEMTRYADAATRIRPRANPD